MKKLNKSLLVIPVLMALVLFTNCKKQPKTTYMVNTEDVFPPNTGKKKLKTEAQFISILYANLFQRALSSNKLIEITNCIESIGDNEVAHEIVVSNFMNESDILIPETSEMLSDVDLFLEETYTRFFVRDITESERAWLKNYIQTNDQVTPELVYFAFTLSNEYLFY